MTKICPHCNSRNLAWPRYVSGQNCPCHPAGWSQTCLDCNHTWFERDRSHPRRYDPFHRESSP